MRILQICAGLDIGGRHGGAERFCLELTRVLNRKHQATLCAFWQSGTKAERAWQEKLENEDVPVFFVCPAGERSSPLNYVYGLVRLLKLVPYASHDIIHSHFQMGSLAAAVLKAGRRAPCALRTAHVTREWGTGCLAAGLRQVFNQRLFPFWLDAETAVSPAVAEQLPLNFWRRQWALTIPNALPEEAFRAVKPAEDLAARFAGDGHFVIGSLGRMTPQKDYASLLQAFSLAAGQEPGLLLALAGDGPERRRLEQEAARLGVGERVHFLGVRSDPQQTLAVFDLLALPSRYEGLPTVLLEAMAAGVPVLASDIPGNRDLITQGSAGWLVQPGDPQGLAAAVLEIYRNPQLRQQFSLRARTAVQSYRMQEIALCYEALYACLLERES